MKILIVGEGVRLRALCGRARGRGNRRRAPPESELAVPDGDEVGELAGALLAFERLFSDDSPDAVLLVSASNLALAAVLVATKLQIPVAALVEAVPESPALGDEPPPYRAARRRHGRRRPGNDCHLPARADRRLSASARLPVHRATYT